MNPEFERCLENKRLVPFPEAKGLTVKEFTSAVEDLEETRESLSRRRLKWCTIQAYYAMFHAARALLYSAGYKERSHQCLAIAMEALFVEKGMMDARLVRNLLNAMALREDADHASIYSEAGAELLVRNSQEFLAKAREILQQGGYLSAGPSPPAKFPSR